MFEKLKEFFVNKAEVKNVSMQSRGVKQIWPLVEELRFLREMYGLRVKGGKCDSLDDEEVMFTPLTYVETLDAVRIVREELVKYPASYIQQLGIKRLRLAKNLHEVLDADSLQMRDIGGIAFKTGQVYSHFESDDYGRGFLRRALHHELLHRADDVEITRSLVGFLQILKSACKWNWLNPSYAYIGERFWDGDYYYDTPAKGFARIYGTRNIDEDRATVAELLMIEPDRARIKCDIDPIFEKKVHSIMRDFKRRSSGLMNTRYFNDLLNGKITPSYWG